MVGNAIRSLGRSEDEAREDSMKCALSRSHFKVFMRAHTNRTRVVVELKRLDRTFKLDIRYATANNFTGRAVYTEARAFLQRPAAEALSRVSRALKAKGYGLAVFDGYRPWSVTKLFWEITPEDKKQFVADPAKGSSHNRG